MKSTFNILLSFLLFLQSLSCFSEESGEIFDSKLNENRRYNEVVWLGAHNAFATKADHWDFYQQTESISKQLEDGVRVLHLDLYYDIGYMYLAGILLPVSLAIMAFYAKFGKKSGNPDPTQASTKLTFKIALKKLGLGIVLTAAVAAGLGSLGSFIRQAIQHDNASLGKFVDIRLCHENFGVSCLATQIVERSFLNARPALDVLNDIKKYMDKNKKAIITLVFQNETYDQLGSQRIMDILEESGLANHLVSTELFLEAKNDPQDCQRWPTIKNLRTKGRLIIFSQKMNFPNGGCFNIDGKKRCILDKWQFMLANEPGKIDNCEPRDGTQDSLKDGTKSDIVFFLYQTPKFNKSNDKMLSESKVNNMYASIESRVNKQCQPKYKRHPNVVVTDFYNHFEGDKGALEYINEINSSFLTSTSSGTSTSSTTSTSSDIFINPNTSTSSHCLSN